MFRIRFKSRWTGDIDGDRVSIDAGKTADVDLATARALVFQRQIAELVPVEEIVKEEKAKSVKKPRTTKKKAVVKPPADKMMEAAVASK